MNTEKNGDKKIKRTILEERFHFDFLFKEVTGMGTTLIYEYCVSKEPLPEDIREKFIEGLCHKLIKRAKCGE